MILLVKNEMAHIIVTLNNINDILKLKIAITSSVNK